MARLAPVLACLAALTMNGTASAGAITIATTDAPPGFAQLTAPRVAMVDVYFGNRKIAEALADTQPGLLRFRAPSDILAHLPELVPSPDVLSRLSKDLPTNSALACSIGKTTSCGSLSPDDIGIIYDEDDFRVDLFINPKLLRTHHQNANAYLPSPSARTSLTSAFGIAAAGSVGGRTSYNLQDRTILALGSARIRTSNAIATGLGWIVDDFVGEVDRKDKRYSAGLFWAPASEFTGQRRILGAGFGTQFDTQRDPGALGGTPLVVFLAQPSRVEIFIHGRLVSSQSYSAGNQQLETSALPQGSYNVLLRIREQNGGVREERRFFVKSLTVPPAGHPIYFGYAGLLANTRAHRPLDFSRHLFFQAGAAWRLSNSAAFDIQSLGTERKGMFQVGGWLVGRPARVRGSALVSTSGDAGLLVQVASTSPGLVNFNFDLRRIWSRDGTPLIPLPRELETFDGSSPIGAQRAEGSYTQAVGSVGLRFGSGNLSVLASYRKDHRLKADYSIGPALTWPLLNRGGLQLVLDISGQRSSAGTAAFAGIRLLSTSGPLSVFGRGGQSIDDPAGAGRSLARATGSVDVQYSTETPGGTQLTGEVGADRDIQSSTVHAGGTMTGDVGYARADIYHGLEGRGGTQFDLSLQSGLAIAGRQLTAGTRQAEPSALIISVTGDAPDATFQVLVDDAPRGELRSGQRLSLFVPAYRAYRVRLLPMEAAAVDFDTATREVSLFPGSVQTLNWRAEATVTIIARAVSIDGQPIADALVEAPKSVAETDGNGYFQIDVKRGDLVTIARADGKFCHVTLPPLPAHKDYAPIGKVICQ